MFFKLNKELLHGIYTKYVCSLQFNIVSRLVGRSMRGGGATPLLYLTTQALDDPIIPRAILFKENNKNHLIKNLNKAKAFFTATQ